MAMDTLVTEIERFSTHDGPGIRTVVFLKGCPLNCRWCHNPECISFGEEEMYYPEKCIGCGKCAEGCYSGARVKCGRRMLPEDVMNEVLEDREYYGENGGVTVSGGEPLAHREFTLQLLRLAGKNGISRGLETSMYRYDGEILGEVDYLMADIKIFDTGLHRQYTGTGNEDILGNIEKADGLGIPIEIRTPVIPGVNDTAENIMSTADFLRKLKNIRKYVLLPYHPLGVTKAKALGREVSVFETPSGEKMEELRKYAQL